MIDRHWDGIAAYCKPENKVSLGFVEGLNNKIRVFQRRAYGLRDEEYLRLKVLSCMLVSGKALSLIRQAVHHNGARLDAARVSLKSEDRPPNVVSIAEARAQRLK